MREQIHSDKLTAHEDWKDGMNAFRIKVSKEITEIYKSIAEIRNLTLKLAEYVEINTQIRNNETKITEGDTP